MTSFFTADPVIEIATQAWCAERLRAADEGILSFHGPQGRLALAVSYTVSGEQIHIVSDPFDGEGWVAAGHEMTLEVAGAGPDDLRWLVRATGMARRSASTVNHPAHAGSGLPSTGLVLPAVRLRGYYETYALDASSWVERA